MKEQRELFCPECKTYPQEIVEKYIDPIVEIRKWDGQDWELTESNISNVEYEQRCGICGSTKLEFKGV